MRVEKSILLTFMGGGATLTPHHWKEKKLLLTDRAWLIFLVLLWIYIQVQVYKRKKKMVFVSVHDYLISYRYILEMPIV